MNLVEYSAECLRLALKTGLTESQQISSDKANVVRRAYLNWPCREADKKSWTAFRKAGQLPDLDSTSISVLKTPTSGLCPWLCMSSKACSEATLAALQGAHNC